MNEIHERGTAKFILVSNNERDFFIVSNPNLNYHSDIFDWYRDKHEGNFRCLGGGRLSIKKDSVTAYGYSIGYGQASGSIVKMVLDKEFQNVMVEVKMGQGY